MKKSSKMSKLKVTIIVIGISLTSACASVSTNRTADEIYQPDTTDKSPHLLIRQGLIDGLDKNRYGLPGLKVG